MTTTSSTKIHVNTKFKVLSVSFDFSLKYGCSMARTAVLAMITRMIPFLNQELLACKCKLGTTETGIENAHDAFTRRPT